MEKKITDLFLDKEYIEFYKEHKRKQDNIVDMINGNICRICVCDDEEELYKQYYNLNLHLFELLRLQKSLNRCGKYLRAMKKNFKSKWMS